MTLEKDLKDEVVKWKERLQQKRQAIVLLDGKKKDFLNNIDSYISDANYFFNRDDLIRAFESVIWAYAWIEIGEKLGVLESKKN